MWEMKEEWAVLMARRTGFWCVFAATVRSSMRSFSTADQPSCVSHRGGDKRERERERERERAKDVMRTRRIEVDEER